MIQCRYLAAIACTLVCLVGCNTGAPVFSLKPQVRSGAADYGEIMADFSDQALLMNVLRARDNAPLNFNDLATITGSFSLTDTYGFTLPFGPLTGTIMGSNTFKNTASPSIAGTSSPVVALSTLNTQGFMMTMVQPISTTYILSKWDSHPHELLLYLFVKSIRFPDEQDDPYDPYKRRVHRNDPDNADDFQDFQTLVNQLVNKTVSGGDVDMKSLMILDPLGNPVPMGQMLQATTPIPAQSPSTPPPMSPIASGVNSMLRMAPEASEPTPRGTYYAVVTYVTKQGETQPSPEESLALNANNFGIVISPPPKLRSDLMGYNIYIGTTHGKETKQNASVVSLDVPWPLRGNLKTDGDEPPRKSKLAYPNNPALSPLPITYYVQITYSTSSGGETAGSPEVEGHVAAFQLLDVAPKNANGASGVIGYNVYVSDLKRKDKKRQNDRSLQLGDSWTKNYKDINDGPPPPVPPGTSYQVSSDYNIFQTISGLNDGQLHAGNASCPKYIRVGTHSDSLDLCPEDSTAPFVQFYKEYPGQVVLCVRAGDDGRFYGHSIAPLSSEEREARESLNLARLAANADNSDEIEQLTQKVQNLTIVGDAQRTLQMVLLAKGGGGPPASGAPTGGSGSGGGAPAGGGGGGGAGGGAGGAGAMGQVTLALQPNRISAMLHSEACNTDQIVLPAATEEDFHTESRKFTHVEWRSIAEVIQYIGALARHQKAEHSAVVWGSGNERLFEFRPGSDGRIAVSYRGDTYSVGPTAKSLDARESDAADHSLESLALLNELISLAKISGNLAAPQTVQVVP